MRALLLVFAVSFVVAQLAFFAERNLFDAARFADHVESALQQPDVRREAGTLLSEQIVRAEPDLIAVEPVIRSVSEGVAGSAAFRAIVRGAAYQLHSSVFGAERDTFALTVTGAGLLVVQALEMQDPQAAAKVPEGIRSTLVSLSDGEFGKALTDLAQIAEKIGVLGWVALALALVSLALLLAPEHDRRRRVRATGYTLAATGALVALALELARALVSAQAANDQAEAAVRGLWDEFFGSLLAFNVALAAGGLVIAAVADSRIRALDPLERARALAGAVAAPPARPWLRALRAAGLGAAGVFLVVSPAAALRLIAGAGGLLLVAVAADEVIAMTAQPPGEKVAARRPGCLRRRVLMAALVFVALAAPLVALAATDGPGAELDSGSCNGSPDLCDRQVDEVAFAATHNSMSSPDSSFLFPDQQSGIVAQLEGGIRGLLIDTHNGVKTGRGVYTLLDTGGKSRDKIEQAVGPDATRTALRLREQIGYRGGGDSEVYLCHGFCELGAIPAEGALRNIREFMAANPGEVLVISIEDQVTPEETKAVFERSGLLDLVWTESDRPPPDPRRDGRAKPPRAGVRRGGNGRRALVPPAVRLCEGDPLRRPVRRPAALTRRVRPQPRRAGEPARAPQPLGRPDPSAPEHRPAGERRGRNHRPGGRVRKGAARAPGPDRRRPLEGGRRGRRGAVPQPRSGLYSLRLLIWNACTMSVIPCISAQMPANTSSV